MEQLKFVFIVLLINANWVISQSRHNLDCPFNGSNFCQWIPRGNWQSLNGSSMITVGEESVITSKIIDSSQNFCFTIVYKLSGPSPSLDVFYETPKHIQLLSDTKTTDYWVTGSATVAQGESISYFSVIGHATRLQDSVAIKSIATKAGDC